MAKHYAGQRWVIPMIRQEAFSRAKYPPSLKEKRCTVYVLQVSGGRQRRTPHAGHPCARQKAPSVVPDDTGTELTLPSSSLYTLKCDHLTEIQTHEACVDDSRIMRI